MSDFEILEHTADTGFRVRGRTVEELFVHAAEALISVALDAERVETRETRAVSASGADLEELLVNWLSEVLWMLDGEGFVPARFDVAMAASSIRARVSGEPRDDARHPPRIVVKAVTFHQLALREQNEGWEAEVFLDI